MLNGLYSKQVFWPEGIQAVLDHVLSDKYVVWATRHAKEKLAILTLPDNAYKISLYGEVIEAEFRCGKLVKIVTRVNNRYNPSVDICSAVIFNPPDTYGNIALVKTIWTNRHDDNHSMINKEMYVNG